MHDHTYSIHRNTTNRTLSSHTDSTLPVSTDIYDHSYSKLPEQDTNTNVSTTEQTFACQQSHLHLGHAQNYKGICHHRNTNHTPQHLPAIQLQSISDDHPYCTYCTLVATNDDTNPDVTIIQRSPAVECCNVLPHDADTHQPSSQPVSTQTNKSMFHPIHGKQNTSCSITDTDTYHVAHEHNYCTTHSGNETDSDNTPDLYDLNNYLGQYTTQSIAQRMYRNFNIPEDGNCLFSCLSLATHGNFSESAIIRNVVCQHIAHNWNAWEDMVKLSQDPTISSAQTYLNFMVHGNGWGTLCEIKAACNLLRVNIDIWLRGIAYNETLHRYETRYNVEKCCADNTTDKVITLHLLNGHYTLLYYMHDIQNHSPGTTLQCTREQQLTGDTNRIVTKKQTIPCKRKHPTAVQNLIVTKKRKQTHTDDSGLGSTHELNSRKLGVPFLPAELNETKEEQKRRLGKNAYDIKRAEKKYNVNVHDLPQPPPKSSDKHFNNVMDSIRAFELQQMAYTFQQCNICNECRLEMKMAGDNICRRCHADRVQPKMYSSVNNMHPADVPNELQDLTLVEQQLICRISPAMHIHMLKHGGIAASGHCVTFPQNVNEPSQILPRLPEDVHVLRVRKIGRNDTSKEFNVRRATVQNALSWLKSNNPAYTDIIISKDRLARLPENGELNIDTVETCPTGKQTMDHGPALQQVDPGDVDADTVSYVTLPETSIDIRQEVENVVNDVVGPCHGPVTMRNKKVTIPWPTRDNIPLSEFTTKHLFTLAFPCLFPDAKGDFHINRPRTCSSMSDWAEHLMWYKDGRFAHHHYFKFVVHNIIMRKRTLEQSSYIVRQQLGDQQLTIADLKTRIEQGDDSIAKKILYFGACLRGTSQYWSQRSRDLRGLIQFQINEENGLPSFFTTGSCAEYHFKGLRRLLQLYCLQTSGLSIDVNDKTTLFSVLQKNTHIVSHYFDLRTQSYFDTVMRTAFDVETYWYRQEFAKSRGMIHWHGLCWRSDREPHHLLHEAIEVGLSSDETADKLAKWAEHTFGMTASHPAGIDAEGNPRKDLWPPPEGTAPPPSEENNPLVKLLLDVSDTQENMLQDHLLLTNRINLHRCSSYCLKQQKSSGDKVCRLEFGTETNPGKIIRSSPEIVQDKNGSMRLEMARDHKMLVQHSRYHTQGWRANGDISLILSKSGPDNPSVDDIIATERYITGYACKGNQPTESLLHLFNEITNSVADTSVGNANTICTKLLMNTVKRDISSVEASYEPLSLPLYRCSHTFQTVSFSGSRVLERSGETLTKRTPLDKYLGRPKDDDSSWYRYICKQGKVPVNNGCCNRAVWPLNEEYARAVLLLHWPNWRQISNIKQADASWVSILETFLESALCPNFIQADVERARRHESPEQYICVNSQEAIDDNPDEQPEWMTLMQPLQAFDELVSTDFVYDDGGPCYNWATSNDIYPPGLGLKWVQELPSDHHHLLDIPDVSLTSLNQDQKFAFNIVMSTLISHRQKPQSTEPLRLIISGTAGSGKSYLIKCLVHTIRKLYRNNKSVQVLGPTGNSANLISGRTIHSFLKVPTSFRAVKELTPPDGVTGLSLQDNCQDVAALLVDERSMVGCRTLGWMEFLCRHGMKAMSSSWGGTPVVVFLGDDVQLPPVLDSPVYMSSAKCPAAIHGTLVWKEFATAVTLRTNVRQNEEQLQFKRVLMSLREYRTSPDDVEWLQQFQWDALKSSHGMSLLADMSRYGLFVFPTHAAEWEHNKTNLLLSNQMAPVAKLVAVNTGNHSKGAPSDKSGGLLPVLYICRGARVMLTTNINVEVGLFNGAMGEVIDIIYLDGRKPPDSLPDVVMVSFSKYTGPPFMQHNPNVVPIVPIERRVDCCCHNCKRKQMPLRLAWGTTIHRCQGMTVGQGEPYRYIVIDPGTRKFESLTPGALFVALSRAKSAGGPQESPDFAWHPTVLVNEDRLCHAVNTPTTRGRSQEIQRIAKIADCTRKKYAELDSDLLFNNICANVGVDQNEAEE